MDANLIHTLRQRTTNLMPVVDYDKTTINEAIELVYNNITNNINDHILPNFSNEQKAIIVQVITEYINSLNVVNEPVFYVDNVRLKIALLKENKLTTINNIINNVNGEYKLWWEYVPSINMYDSRVQEIAQAANISSEELLQIFELANTIE